MPNLFLHSINIYEADGATDEWDFRFDGVNPDDSSGTTPYLHPDDVKVQERYTDTDGGLVIVDRDRELIAPNRVRVLGTLIPSGHEVRVYRETENRYPLVDYRDMQTVGSADLDLHARQTLFVAMEAIDVAFLAEQASERAEDTAGEANVTANNALQVAQGANETANEANSTADSASAAAAAAVLTADDARTVAGEAMVAADSVRTLAEDAATDAAAAAASALVAQDAATTAVAVAGAVDGKAQTALDNSEVALLEAAEALSTANGVDAKAQTALDNSGVALSDASLALSTAQGVDAKAQEALDTAEAAQVSITGAVTELQGQIDENRTHVLSMSWEPTRALIAGGHAPLDGQTLTRDLFPDAWAQAQAVGMVISDSEWLADPLKRGFFSDGDGTTTFRLPDYNGKSAGTLGAVFQRGDGALSAAIAGVIQQDALQDISGSFMITRGYLSNGDGAFAVTEETPNDNGYSGPGSLPRRRVTLDASRVARTASETRPLNVTGCWVIKLFGSMVNVGSADAAQLASDYASLSAALQTLDSQIDFTIIYPNGGSAGSPASVLENSRYVEANPFPGFEVIAVAQVLYEGNWGDVPMSQASASSNNGAGIAAHTLGDDLIVQLGNNGIIQQSSWQGNPFGYSGGIIRGPLPCRIKVWKVKGSNV